MNQHSKLDYNLENKCNLHLLIHKLTQYFHMGIIPSIFSPMKVTGYDSLSMDLMLCVGINKP